MIDFGVVKKYIYFPRKIERKTEPFVIYVLDKWGVSWRGNVDIDGLLARVFAFYEISRCQPYSEALWEQCQEWVKKRDALDAEFLDLMNGGSR